ncbi:hypothetical protein [Pseudomonas sp. Snoq117.2]|uniref:DUF7302 family protein n=1 Tax=Pseudomonas sp. Snoq117.2 TaxID=1500302 RepID=UPI0008D41807|nr:hypothetical protein [Pseudomonas sp. Snoq117.2]SEO42834.1 hypothetical protein SAMN02787149_10140 [Pseudomonas sp. Snoq117.2]
MKILILWGFEGNAELLKADTSRIRAGQTFDDVDEEYAHQLIGKGLAEEVGESKQAAPKTTKPAKPDENKGGKADKADADAGAKKDGEGA